MLSRNLFLEGDFELEADDIISGEPWVCAKLESLKVRIVGVPRPDITKKRNSRLLGGHLHQGIMKESRKIQRGVYEQLGRLTKLKQLVLGNNEVECGNGGYEQDNEIEEDDELTRYREEVLKEVWRQYECLEMAVESGMEVMAGLKELRYIELGAMSVGTIDQGWVDKNWPRLGSMYKDTFWTDHGYID